jgi:CHAD domain-containing protein
VRDGAVKSNSVKSAVEREVKLTVDAGFRLPALRGSRLPAKILTSVYYDTPELRLARSRITLRHRTEGRRTVWQLKLPLESGRREVEMPGKASTPPSQLLDLLFIHLQGDTVHPIVTLRTRRTGVRVGGSKGVEVVLDEVAVLRESSEVLIFREVEIERLDGDAALAARLERTLRKAGATHHDGRPKMFRALDLPAPRKPEPPQRGDPAGSHLRYILGRQLDIMMSRDPGVRLGGDIEDVHQMRVATRRLRSVLRVARPLLEPDWEKRLRDKLGWLGRRLGEARDLDVQIDHFKAQSHEDKPHDRTQLETFISSLEKKRGKVQRRLMHHLQRPRYVALINRLIAAVQEPAIVPNDVRLPDLAGQAFKKLRQAVKRLDHSASDDKWHRVRIQTKRARYAAELSEWCSGRTARRFIDKIKLIQDQLGDIQDAVIAETHLRQFLSRNKGRKRLPFLANQMIQRQRRRRRQAKHAFFSTWKQVKKCGQEAWT